jgi:hypothetical protein
MEIAYFRVIFNMHCILHIFRPLGHYGPLILQNRAFY